MRYRFVTYRYKEGTSKQLEQHYRQLINDALRQAEHAIVQRSTIWRPPADILESPEKIRVKVELAGLREEEIDVTLYADALVISGERRIDHENQENLSYYEAQIRYGPFRVEVFIPTPIIRNDITAHYENGMLLVDLPKLTPPVNKPERIHVQRSEKHEETF